MSISDRLDEIEVRRAQANSSLNGRHMLVGKDVPELVEAVRRRDAALHAVLNLHKPYDQCVDGCCRYCEDCEHTWPCPTRSAAAAALGEES